MAIGRFGATNREYWDGEVDLNLKSWDIEAFFSDPARLTRMVAADREALGDVQGRSLIHLQCHFGLDTLAWSRLGADVTGVDFSPRAIATAIDLPKRDGARARFIEADLYATPQVVPEVFDVVYTSGGVLCWLPEISTWANVVSRLLKPEAYSTSVRLIPCCGHWTTNAKTRSCSSACPTLRCPSRSVGKVHLPGMRGGLHPGRTTSGSTVWEKS